MANPLQLMRSVDASARSLYGDSPWRFFKYARISLFSFNRFVVFCADPACPTVACDPLELREWSQEKLEAFRRGKGLPKEFYADRLHGLRRLWVAEKDGQPAYIAWVCEARDKSAFLRLEPREAEISHILTIPGFRREKLHTRGMVTLVKLLGAEGRRLVYVVVHSGNTYSIRGCEAAGMRPVGHVYALGPLRFKRPTDRLRGETS